MSVSAPLDDFKYKNDDFNKHIYSKVCCIGQPHPLSGLPSWLVNHLA